jgi:chromosome partitioning protein
LTRHDPVADPLTASPVELAHQRIPAGGLLLYRGGRSLADTGEADLADHFRRAASDRAVVLIDCEPAIRTVTPAAVREADLVLVPMQPTPGSLPGLGDAQQLVQSEQKAVCMRIALTAVPNRAISKIIAEQVDAAFPGQLYRAQIPSDVAAANSVSAFLPVTLWRPSSASAKAYVTLAEEIAIDLGLSLSPVSHPAPNDQ